MVFALSLVGAMNVKMMMQMTKNMVSVAGDIFSESQDFFACGKGSLGMSFSSTDEKLLRSFRALPVQS